MPFYVSKPLVYIDAYVQAMKAKGPDATFFVPSKEDGKVRWLPPLYAGAA